MMWHHNGDHLSIEYTGTGALKGDLTKNGNFTLGGLVADAAKSVKRTYLNFFSDHDRQQLIDFFLGVQTIKEDVEEELDLLKIELQKREKEFTEQGNQFATFFSAPSIIQIEFFFLSPHINHSPKTHLRWHLECGRPSRWGKPIKLAKQY